MSRGGAPRGWLGAVPALLLALALFPAGSRAALHPLSGVNHNATSQTSTLDLTFSVDWNLDSAPTGTWNRSTYRNMIKSFATSIFSMTEGRHRVGKVYTFMNKRSWDKVDIRFVANRTGHSAADPADFRGGSGAVNLYLVFSDGSREGYVGPVLAHESGHYIYGFMDEYAGGSSPGSMAHPCDPGSDDYDSQPSVMNSHSSYPRQLSTPAAYNTEEKRKTAQFRTYNASAWGMLTRHPSKDPPYARNRYDRTYYQAFNMTPPATLTMPTAGYDDALNFRFMENGTVCVLAFDPRLSSTDWASARRAAQAVVQGLAVNSSVLAPTGVAAAIGKTTITGAAARTALANRVAALTPGASTDLDTVLRSALANASAARAVNQTATVHLMALGNPAVGRSLLTEYVSAKVALNVPALRESTGEADPVAAGLYSLARLARNTGGRYQKGKNPAQAAAKATRSASELEGDNAAVIAEVFADQPLEQGEAETLEFTIGAHDGVAAGNQGWEIEIVFTTHPDDYARITPTLRDPAGNVLTVASVQAGLNAGVTLETDAAGGQRVFQIDRDAYAGVQGQWQAKVTATADLDSPAGIAAEAISQLQLGVDLRQFENSMHPRVEARLVLDRPVLGARVRADVYGPDGGLVAQGLVLRDDGQGGDLAADDGVYAATLDMIRSDGEYSVQVTADNPGGAVACSRGVYANNPLDTAQYSLGSFQRMEEGTASLSAVRGDSARGCVLGGPGRPWDMGLAALLAGIAGIFCWRRRP